jgi:hypothetical protein
MGFLVVLGDFVTIEKGTKWIACSALALGLLTFPVSLRAHHGNSAYDLDKPIAFKGIVTEFAWSNPHVQIYFDTKDDKGKTVGWACETLSPGLLVRAGWTKDELKPGDQMVITLGPAKSGAPVGYALKIVLANGKELKLGQGRDRPYQ